MIAHLLLALQEAAVTIPERPATGSYVVDDANVLDAVDVRQIDAAAGAAARGGRPIYVVTIPSLEAERASSMSVGDYTRRVFDAWHIGGGPESRGALLLVSLGDRRARIELGHAWNHERDDEMRDVMDRLVTPAMKSGRPGLALLNGVRGIDAALSAAPWMALAGYLAYGALVVLAGLLGFWVYRTIRRQSEAERAEAQVEKRQLIALLRDRPRRRMSDVLFGAWMPQRRRRDDSSSSSATDHTSWSSTIYGGSFDSGSGGGSDSGGSDTGSSSGGGGADGSW